MTVWLLLGLGLVILVFAGDALVKGAVNLALRLGIPPLIVGLTVVGFGTSSPELIVSVKAALEGQSGIALGNVVGSNIANVFVILGLPALIAVMHTSQIDTKKPFLIMFAVSVIFTAMAFLGEFGRLSGLFLLAILALILWDAVRDSRKSRDASPPDLDGADDGMPWWKIITYLAVGLIGLPIGADLLVDNAVIIATAYDVPETVIGLTLVALGTSLPELAATTIAAIRRQADVAIGNVIGSNYFNLAGIIGVAAVISPMPVEQTFLVRDLWVMLGAALMLVPFVFFKQDITRLWGIVLLALYGAYATIALI